MTPGDDQPAVWTPIDIIEAKEEVHVLVDVPGYRPDAIQIEATGTSVRITATRSGPDEEFGNPVYRERPDRIDRVVSLPVHLDIDHGTAAYEDGVLRVTLPKALRNAGERSGFIDSRRSQSRCRGPGGT